jgi:hypothetical protein
VPADAIEPVIATLVPVFSAFKVKGAVPVAVTVLIPPKSEVVIFFLVTVITPLAS